MRVPLSWLRDFVAIEMDPYALAHQMTMAGLETEVVERVAGDLEGVVIVEITRLERHPNADRLLVATVDHGDRLSTIVTGAPNLNVGDRVPLVMPGGRIWDASANPPALREIGSTKLRGVLSDGMLCAGDELGISPDHAGIFKLLPDAPLGAEIAAYLNDYVLDVYITPNRPDCMSVIGVAREIAALTGRQLRPLEWALPEGEIPAASLCAIEVQEPQLCPRYSAMVIRDLAIGPSPDWMQVRLHLSGVRPINNVVDITNYVMLETGQPMHAFDAGAVKGGIVVRRARDGERLNTLDGQERELHSHMLMIADHERTIGVAGVMGGANTEIGPETRLVVLESANFEQRSVRKTSRDLNLRTEAAHRFERGLDPANTIPSAARAVQLMVELARGRPASGAIDVYTRPEKARTIELTLDEVEALLGRRYERADIERVLTSLQFEVSGAEPMRVLVPSHRRDVERKADLVEEIARVTGYDAIPEALFQGRIPEPKVDPERHFERRARQTLAAAGCQEVITYSLVHPNQRFKLDLNADWPRRDAIAADQSTIFNPMSIDQSVLRQTLLGSLLETLRGNLRYRERVWLFEIARVYLPPFDPLPREPKRVGLALAGSRLPAGWSTQQESTDFLDLKGVLDQLFGALGVRDVAYIVSEHSTLQPGRSASIHAGGPDGPRLGIMGQLHPTVGERFDLDGREVLLAELELDSIRLATTAISSSRELPAHQDLKLDLAVVVAESVPYERVERELRQAGGTLLAEVRLFDVYRGAPIPEDHRSLAFALSFQAPDRTLTDVEIAPRIEAIEQHLAARLGARIRRS